MDDLPREVDLESDSEEIRSYNSTASESLPGAPDADLSSTLAESPCVIKRKGGRKPIYATSEERKQRNRQAQAAFRERRSGYIKQLEATNKHNEDELHNLRQSLQLSTEECSLYKYKVALLSRVLLEKGIDIDVELRFTKRHHGLRHSLDGGKVSALSGPVAGASARVKSPRFEPAPKPGAGRRNSARPDLAEPIGLPASLAGISSTARSRRPLAQPASQPQQTRYQVGGNPHPLLISSNEISYDATFGETGYVMAHSPDFAPMAITDGFETYHSGGAQFTSLGKLSRSSPSPSDAFCPEMMVDHSPGHSPDDRLYGLKPNRPALVSDGQMSASPMYLAADLSPVSTRTESMSTLHSGRSSHLSSNHSNHHVDRAPFGHEANMYFPPSFSHA